MSNTYKQKYQQLVEQYKTLKTSKETYIKELSEKKGNMTAYEAERDECIAQAKELGVDPKDLKKEIDELIERIQQKLTENEAICKELDTTE